MTNWIEEISADNKPLEIQQIGNDLYAQRKNIRETTIDGQKMWLADFRKGTESEIKNVTGE